MKPLSCENLGACLRSYNYIETGAHANFITPDLATKLSVLLKEMGPMVEGELACPDLMKSIITLIHGEPHSYSKLCSAENACILD